MRASWKAKLSIQDPGYGSSTLSVGLQVGSDGNGETEGQKSSFSVPISTWLMVWEPTPPVARAMSSASMPRLNSKTPPATRYSGQACDKLSAPMRRPVWSYARRK